MVNRRPSSERGMIWNLPGINWYHTDGTWRRLVMDGPAATLSVAERRKAYAAERRKAYGAIRHPGHGFSAPRDLIMDQLGFYFLASDRLPKSPTRACAVP
jgi:hypothetical protein